MAPWALPCSLLLGTVTKYHFNGSGLLICWFYPQFSSIPQLCLTLCDPRGHSTPGFPVHHQLPKLAQTHVHQVSDTIQPSHLLSSPSPPAFTLSQHQGLFKWVSSSHQVTKGLELQLQHQSFQWIFRTDFLVGQTGWNSLKSKGLLAVFSNTTVQKYQFFGTHLSLQLNSYIHTWLLKKPALTRWTFVGKVMSLFLICCLGWP